MRFLRLVLSCGTGLVAWSSVCGQVGNNNPTGVAGAYGPLITTGCAYSPFTANATRVVTDLTVSGAVGAYPLALTRYMNSRSSGSSFGQAGGWRHSYQWSIAPITFYSSPSPVKAPSSYTVSYPDGRVVNFAFYNRGGDLDFQGPPGVRDRMEPVPGGSAVTQYCSLRLPDGGKIVFAASRDSADLADGGPWDVTWNFVLQSITDPYGKVTNITTPAAGVTLSRSQPAAASKSSARTGRLRRCSRSWPPARRRYKP